MLQLSAPEGFSHSIKKLDSGCPLARACDLTIVVLANDKGDGAVETGTRLQSSSFTYRTKQKDDEDSREDMDMPGGNEEISKTDTTDAGVTTSRQVPDVSNNLRVAEESKKT
jgi:hypothetical protein